VVAVPSGIGGYGGHAVIGGLPENKVTAIDFNPPLQPPSSRISLGRVKRGSPRQDQHARLAVDRRAGVLAGLQLALDKFGTKKFPKSFSRRSNSLAMDLP
jgi:hypothetical protein